MNLTATGARARVALLVAGGLALLAVPAAAHGQSRAALPRIAVLVGDTPLSTTCLPEHPDHQVGVRAFVEGLRSLGYRDGANVALECRSAEGKYDRLPALAAELVHLRPAVLVASAAPASVAAKRATSSVPIVSLYTVDPVALGLVASLARPGGNVTGISSLAGEYVAKSLQLLKEVAPRTSRVGVLGHAANPGYAIYRRELERAGLALGVKLDFEPVDSPAGFDAALSALHRLGANAFFVMHQPLTFEYRGQIVKEVARLRVPATYGGREHVELGGLISYSVSVADVYRRGALLVDKILRGAAPADLPVEQPTVFQLAVNLKTAASLGLTIPAPLVLRADTVVR